MNSTIEMPRHTPQSKPSAGFAPNGSKQKETLSPKRIMRLGLGFFASKTVLAATELGLFTALARGPMDLESLRQNLGCIREAPGTSLTRSSSCLPDNPG